MTFIESVQRVVTRGYSPLKMKKVEINGKIKDIPMTPLEWKVYNREEHSNGVLWCITKLFTCDENFTGTSLLYTYLMRLLLTIFCGVIGFAIIFAQGYIEILFLWSL